MHTYAHTHARMFTKFYNSIYIYNYTRVWFAHMLIIMSRVYVCGHNHTHTYNVASALNSCILNMCILNLFVYAYIIEYVKVPLSLLS